MKTSAVADLQLVLRRPRLLGSCLLAVGVPFGIYAGLLFGLHKGHDWALFVAAPMIVAGVLIGALLDRAYADRESPARSSRPVESASRS